PVTPLLASTFPPPTSLSRCLSSAYRPLRRLLSFPTRRSSDLRVGVAVRLGGDRDVAAGFDGAARARLDRRQRVDLHGCTRHRDRSEEHTSELQSHLNLVCRLLLEKKKITEWSRSMQTAVTAIQ